MEVDSYLVAVVVITLTTLLAIAGLILVRRKVPVQTLASFHEVGGYLLSVIGTMYAVLLGLIVVDAMTKFENAQQNTLQEANALADVFMLSSQYPEARKKEIQGLCIKSAQDVIEKEWPAMDSGRFSSECRQTAIDLVSAVSNFEPSTNRDQSLYQVVVQEACQMWDNRHARIYTASGGLPEAEWAALIVGGVATVVFTYFFGLENFKAQVAMTAMVALLIALNLYLVLLFGYPHSGDLKVHPRAFQSHLEVFKSEINKSRVPTDLTLPE